MTKDKKSKFGFSLIELSIVILVIGILVIGISQGSRIMSEARLKSARSLSHSSPVNSIEGLGFWLDATDSSNIAVGSAGFGAYGAKGDNEMVTEWRSRNIGSNIILTATDDSKRPTYISNSINGLPSLRFTSGNTLSSTAAINSLELINNNQNTTFAVFHFNSIITGANCLFVFQSSSSNRIANLLSAANPGAIRFDYGTGGVGGIANGVTNVIDRNYIMTSDKNVTTHTIYLNGTSDVSRTNSDTITPFSATFYLGSYLGTANYINANLAELIIFKRALKTNERNAVEEYLGQKWGIKIN
jgi:prepilin-type N-terminal cleavage/methylation domain-containing protein